ncbi:hypothetical protein OG21DRAFT_747613 [Imleria badia]|nr:hypothetical protein OG21DRAFT_747613 [Imleria badia]
MIYQAPTCVAPRLRREPSWSPHNSLHRHLRPCCSLSRSAILLPMFGDTDVPKYASLTSGFSNVITSALYFGNSRTNESTIYIAISLALQNFLLYCFAPRLVINIKECESRVRMSDLGGELSDIVFNEGRLTQDEEQMLGLS